MSHLQSSPNSNAILTLFVSFTEWVEFSPYEIGMTKYGTFMKTEHFGSKFFCGKLLTPYPEPTLSYLQGIKIMT